MNLKEIFDKGENGTLNFDLFEKYCKEGKIKLADLSEGNYVSKSKYDDDIKAKDDSIAQLNSTIQQRDTDLTGLKEQLKSAGTDATKLSDLQSQFDSLQNKYTADVQQYQQQLEHQRYEFAVREFASSKQFTSNAAKRDFTAAMINANLKWDDAKGKILGADDFVTSYSEDNADAFVKEEPKPTEPTPATPAQPKPMFVNPTGGTNNGTPADKKLFGFEFTTIKPIDKK